MSEYDNTNRGVLFRNDKEGNDKRPDFKGSINIDGKEFQLSCWEKESRNGKPYLSLAVEKPFNKQEQKTDPKPQVQDMTSPGDEDEILF